jgi:uncharacterized protein HemX
VSPTEPTVSPTEPTPTSSTSAPSIPAGPSTPASNVPTGGSTPVSPAGLAVVAVLLAGAGVVLLRKFDRVPSRATRG